MALLCNDVEIKGKRKEIWCKHTGAPCVFIRYCSLNGRFYHTDAAKTCKMRGKNDGEKE